MLNFRVLSRWASGKEVTTCWYESPINPIKPWAECYILTPLRDRRPHRSTPSQERPLLATSVHPVPAHVPFCVTTLGPHQPCSPCLGNCDTRARETTRVGFDTILSQQRCSNFQKLIISCCFIIGIISHRQICNTPVLWLHKLHA